MCLFMYLCNVGCDTIQNLKIWTTYKAAILGEQNLSVCDGFSRDLLVALQYFIIVYDWFIVTICMSFLSLYSKTSSPELDSC